MWIAFHAFHAKGDCSAHQTFPCSPVRLCRSSPGAHTCISVRRRASNRLRALAARLCSTMAKTRQITLCVAFSSRLLVKRRSGPTNVLLLSIRRPHEWRRDEHSYIYAPPKNCGNNGQLRRRQMQLWQPQGAAMARREYHFNSYIQMAIQVLTRVR